MARRLTTAAGVIALDTPASGEPRVLLVHRPAYDDWSLPKGKIHSDEFLPSCAARETFEETGVSVRLGAPVGHIRYTVSGGPKEVHYWRATAVGTVKRSPDHEVDKIAWLTARTALARMSYGDERALLDRALAVPHTTPFIVVRHGKAMERKNWVGRDQARPLNARGRRQAAELVPLLTAYGVARVHSSSSTRCVQTLRPYAKASGLDVEGWSTLSEELAHENEKAVVKLMRRLVEDAGRADLATAVCGHRPVLPVMLSTAGLEARSMQTGAVVVAHRDASGAVVEVEWHKPRT